jgi:hypothetical protein
MSSTGWRSPVVLLALVACVCSASAPVIADAQAPARQPAVTTDVVYGHKDGLALTLDVHGPARPNSAGLISIVSGAWQSSVEMAQIFAQAYPPLIEKGFTVFAVSLIRTIALGEHDQAVVLTNEGGHLLDANRRERDHGGFQEFYAGVNRPRELQHDSASCSARTTCHTGSTRSARHRRRSKRRQSLSRAETRGPFLEIGGAEMGTGP